jgi:phosphoribosylamine-glycine ligase
MLSVCGDGCGLLKRIQDEGNDCTIDITHEDYDSTYDGILKKSKQPPTGSIIVADASSMGKELDQYKKKGFKVFGGSVFADSLEEDRGFGLKYMESHGIQIPDTKTFRTFVEAIDFMNSRKEKERFVFKPNGDNLPCKLTYVGTDKDDLISYLRFVQRHFTHEIDDFILQTFVEGPIVSTEFWVGPSGFIRPANHTVEVKKFLNDNLGPSTGCQGNLVWLADDDEIVGLLENIEQDLVKEGYIGPIDLNAILSEDGIKGLEWTPRFGYDAMPTFLELIDGDVGQLISDTVNDQIDEMDLFDSIAAGIKISIPPYPIEAVEHIKPILKESPNVGVPIRDLDEDATYFYEIKMEDGQMIHSIGLGSIGCVVDCGDEAEDSLDYPYECLEKARIPEKQYRTDLKEVLPKMMEEACEALEYVSA